MGYSQYDPAMQDRAPWNAGKKVGTKRPLSQKQIWAVRFFLDREARIRDRALFDLAIDSKLRGCTWSNSRSATWLLAVRSEGERPSYSKRRTGPFSSN